MRILKVSKCGTVHHDIRNGYSGIAGETNSAIRLVKKELADTPVGVLLLHHLRSINKHNIRIETALVGCE